MNGLKLVVWNLCLGGEVFDAVGFDNHTAVMLAISIGPGIFGQRTLNSHPTTFMEVVVSKLGGLTPNREQVTFYREK